MCAELGPVRIDHPAIIVSAGNPRGREGESERDIGFPKREGESERDSGFPKQREDRRVVHVLDSFSIPAVVAALVTGFSLSLFCLSTSTAVKSLLFATILCELYTMVFLSLVAVHCKHLDSIGDETDGRAARYLYRVRVVTAVAMTSFTVGVLGFFAAFLVEAYEEMDVPIEACLAVGIASGLLAILSWIVVDAGAKEQDCAKNGRDSSRGRSFDKRADTGDLESLDVEGNKRQSEFPPAVKSAESVSFWTLIQGWCAGLFAGPVHGQTAPEECLDTRRGRQ